MLNRRPGMPAEAENLRLPALIRSRPPRRDFDLRNCQRLTLASMLDSLTERLRLLGQSMRGGVSIGLFCGGRHGPCNHSLKTEFAFLGQEVSTGRSKSDGARVHSRQPAVRTCVDLHGLASRRPCLGNHLPNPSSVSGLDTVIAVVAHERSLVGVKSVRGSHKVFSEKSRPVMGLYGK